MFTRAVAQAGVSQSALSQTVRTLARRIDRKPLNRTTRSVSLTEAGERLYRTVAADTRRGRLAHAEMTMSDHLVGLRSGA